MTVTLRARRANFTVFATVLLEVARKPTISRFASGPMAIGSLRTGLYSGAAAGDCPAITAAQHAQPSANNSRPMRGIVDSSSGAIRLISYRIQQNRGLGKMRTATANSSGAGHGAPPPAHSSA